MVRQGEEVRFATASPVERDGFEPSVGLPGTAVDQKFGRSWHLVGSSASRQPTVHHGSRGAPTSAKTRN